MKKAALTRKKTTRLQRLKMPPQSIQGTPLNYPTATAARYRSRIDRRIDDLIETIRKSIKREMKSPAFDSRHAFDSAPTQTAAANRILGAAKKRFGDLFGDPVRDINAMFRSIDKASSSGLNASLKDLSGGLSLKTTVLTGSMQDAINADIANNVQLIKSIGQDILDRISESVYRSISSGNGLQDLLSDLNNIEGMSKRRARTIAYDQTRKAYSNINKQRLTKLGVKKFKWLHSGGGSHPRKLHVEANGKIYDLDDPPHIGDKGEAVLPGQAINCRCKMVPVLDFGGNDAS